MALRVYILGDAAAYQNYTLAVERAGGIPCFGSRPADCDCLLLPGGGDMESWRYGQKNTACRDLEPERDALELDLLAELLRREQNRLAGARTHSMEEMAGEEEELLGEDQVAE